MVIQFKEEKDIADVKIEMNAVMKKVRDAAATDKAEAIRILKTAVNEQKEANKKLISHQLNVKRKVEKNLKWIDEAGQVNPNAAREPVLPEKKTDMEA